ncbi:MAG: ABC transporter permease [Cyclobacteriaceae bacterium]|jgi:putative ABC transport system permease protein|nr:ABC transporter permease [Flammeovirgaceae bacterium]MCZ8021268.1 ABC transporter permease [Cytophagales bacterium]MCZ8326534.1 ABC transporter permease [Cyclobacteriaceae bacterium]
MNLVENIKEGLRSIKANMLRSVLTSCIVAIGITSLVGILTAIDGIEYSVNTSLSSLGVNTFDITSKRNRGSSNQGIAEKKYPQLTFTQVNRFAEQFKTEAVISLSADVTGVAEVKYLSNKTNPNVRLKGVNTEFFGLKGVEIEKGRNFSKVEMDYGTQVAVIGFKVAETLFKNEEDPVGKEILITGVQLRIIGVMKEKGDLADDNYDNMVCVPLIKANQMAKGRQLWYEISVGISDPTKMDFAMGEATGIMRGIRRDEVGRPNSFDLEKSETLQEQLEGITSALRLGGFGVGFITLLGASIALMNIMLVSVTERTREVGVRKALGATPLRIRQQFVIEAIVVCVLGGLAGIILGILIGNGISSLIGVDEFVIPWTWMFMGMLICIGVGLLSGYYPAHKASKLDPIESLRFE